MASLSSRPQMILPDGFPSSIASSSEQAPSRLRPFSSNYQDDPMPIQLDLFDFTHLPTHCTRWGISHPPFSSPQYSTWETINFSCIVAHKCLGPLLNLMGTGAAATSKASPCSLSHPMVTPTPGTHHNPNLACQALYPRPLSRVWGHGSVSNRLVEQA